MRVAVPTKPEQIDLQQRDIPEPGPGDVLVRASSVGVCGSDTHYFRDSMTDDAAALCEPLSVGIAAIRRAPIEAGSQIAATVRDPSEVTDLGVDASGAPAAVRSGMHAVRPAGTVVLVESCAESMPLPTQLIQNRELMLTGVLRSANTWPTALALVESGRVDLDEMGTARYPLEKVAEALDSDRLPGNVKSVVTVS